MGTEKPTSTPVDWPRLAADLQRVMAHMIHHEKERRLHGDEFYAEALRRLLGARPPGDPPHIPYETVSRSTGLMTVAEADHLRDAHTVVDRLNREAAERQRDEARAEARRILREAARDLAEFIRGWTNERTVPSRYRREGVLLAADWIDPDSPASPYKGG